MVAVIDREEFLTRRWQYRAGEHVTLLGPNGSGKTQLAYQLLGYTANRRLPAVVMVMKPKDDTVTHWDRQLGLVRVRTWPVPSSIWRKPTGWTVWPTHTFDPDVDDPHHQALFRAVILDSYKRGRRILFADEVAGLSAELSLKRPLSTVWMRGRTMGCGLWAASQRPVDVPLHAYSQAMHLFLFNEPDQRGRQRFNEIGGFDGRIVAETVASLPEYHCLYIRRRDRRICVIAP